LNLELTDEQQMLREAAAGALARHDTVAAAREARDGADAPDLWPVAREAGWSGLLVGEEQGGAGLGLNDAMLVLTECGRRLAGPGLLGHLPATLVLSRAAAAGDQTAAGLLGSLASGERRAALVGARPPCGDTGWAVDVPGGGTAELPRATVDGRRALLEGSAAHVPDLAGADVVVVPAQAEDGTLCVAVLDPDAAGVGIEPVVRGDASRPLAKLTLSRAEGELVEVGAEALAEAWDVTQALLAAEALGVCEAMLEMAVAYAKDRYAFGRPIGSYQAIKQQIVEILRYTDKLRSLCVYAGLAAEGLPEELTLAAASARLAGEQAADYATRTCIAVHGGIGATWEHDAPFYWRRAQLSRLLLGGEPHAADRVAEEVIAQAA
jgi:alkylation response protein AidB-like acyl-CoA dehydrogenase